MKKSILFLTTGLLIVLISCETKTDSKENIQDTATNDHFDPKGNTPSEYTIAKWQDLKNKMPFKDERDFDEQKKD